MTDAELRKELDHIRAAWERGAGGDFHRLLFVAEQLMIQVESDQTRQPQSVTPHHLTEELAETVALRFGIEPVPDSVVQSVLYYLRSLPTDDNGVYVHLIGHSPGSLLKE